MLLLVPLSDAQAQEQPRTHDVTIDDYFTQADIFQIALSPKLNAVAYTEGRWQKATDDRKSDLWIASADNPARRLTSDRANDRSPQWDPDGRLIYFLGNRKREGDKRPPYDGKTQVWRIPASGINAWLGVASPVFDNPEFFSASSQANLPPTTRPST